MQIIRLKLRKNHLSLKTLTVTGRSGPSKQVCMELDILAIEEGTFLKSRLWWLIIFVTAVSFCTIWIVRTYNRWVNNPIIVNFAKRPMPVWEIPFPAVTVCPRTKLRKSDYKYKILFQKKRYGEKMTEDELSTMDVIYLLCKFPFLEDDKKLYANEFLLDSMHKNAPDFLKIFSSCQWNKKFHRCEDLFKPVITEEGICYTFNTLDSNDIYTNTVFKPSHVEHNTPRNNWNLESGYSKNAGMGTFPRRARSADAADGLIFYLNGDIGANCNPGRGFKILLHRPDETPRINSQYFKTGIDEELTVTVTPNMMKTSEDVKPFSVKKRQCYFSADRKLHFYKDYTQRKCEIECLADYTLEKCKCVAFYMPRRNESTKICGSGNVECMIQAQNELYGKIGTNNTLQNMTCNCLPECTYLSYVAETSQVQKFSKADKSMPYTEVTIFFKESQFLPTQRNILYSIEDFLANCGGVLGLFIGFSFLSLMEIFYFLTLRIFCNVRQFGRHLWSGSPELLIATKK